jgi:tetratricopeptide (TPR) repeat protein
MASSRLTGRPAGAPGSFLQGLLVSPARFPALLSLVLLGVYAGSFGNGFHYDDFHSLVENPHVRDLGNLGRYFAEPELFSALPERAMYRPLVLVSYALNYWFSGYGAAGYHLVNWGLHLACALLLFWLGRLLPGSGMAPALGALLFALHPLQAEVVNYVSSRSETLAACACLASLLAYGRWRRGGPGWLYGVSVGALACGLLSKSTALAWPLVLALCEWSQPGPRRWPWHLGYWLAAGVYLLLTQSMIIEALGQPVRPLGVQLLTQLKAGVYYLYLTAAPLRLSVEHPFGEAWSLLELPAALSALLLVSLAGVLWRLGGGGGRLLAAAGVVVLLPASLVPLNVLVNEHRLYLFLAPACLGVAALAAPRGRLAWGGALLLGALGLLSHQRSRVWQDELTLWQDAVRRAPGMYRAHLHLGGALEEQGRLPEALVHYQRAVQLAPEVVETHYNLGNALRQTGRPDEAAEAYSRALALQPDFAQALANLGTLYLEAGEAAQAEPLLVRAAQLRPEVAQVQLQLGVLFRAQGRLSEAEAAYQRALGLRPDLPGGYYNLANLYRDTGREAQAIGAYGHALALGPHPGAYYNLGDLHLRRQEYPQAAEVFARGLALLPGEARFHYGLGRAQEGLGLGAQAAASYRAFLASGQAPPAVAAQVRQRLQDLENTPQETR